MNKNSFIPLLLTFLLPMFSSAQNLQKIDPSLFATADQSQVSALVILSKQVDWSTSPDHLTKERKSRYVYWSLRHQAENTQGKIIKYLTSNNIEHQSYFIVNAVSVICPSVFLSELAQFDEVMRIEPNFSFPLKPNSQDITARLRTVETNWGLPKIMADSVWALGIRGQGVVIGGEDTGYEWDHEAIKTQYRGYNIGGTDHNYNWHDAIHEIDPMNGDSIIAPQNNPCGLNSVTPCDDHNHGTHTMGTMVGLTPDRIIGVAPSSKWIGCRCMERGYGKPSTYIECFEWFLAPTDLMGENPNPDLAPHVINNSWGCPPEEGCNTGNFETMKLVLDHLKMAGIFVVTSAGNDGRAGCSTVNSPASIFDDVISVGASNRIDSITAFSSKGPVIVDGSNRMKPDVVAPGTGILSSIRGNRYASWAGTSMAGPHVAGTIALMISANPSLAGQVDKLERILTETSDPIFYPTDCDQTQSIPNNTYGYGRVNAYEAVKAALAYTTSTNMAAPMAVDIFPNPVGDILTLSISDPGYGGLFQIFDVTGKRRLQGNLAGSLQLSVAHLNAGIYFLHFQSNHTFAVQKIIVQ